MYFLTGWTVLIYMSLPVVRILTGAQPLAGATADQFLVHFAPYYGIALLTVAAAVRGHLHVHARSRCSGELLGADRSVDLGARPQGRFVVTPKKGASAVSPEPCSPPSASWSCSSGWPCGVSCKVGARRRSTTCRSRRCT